MNTTVNIFKTQYISDYIYNKKHVRLISHYILGIFNKKEKIMIYDDKNFIGNVIRNARKQAKLNQSELSEKLGMSEKNLGNIENGRQYPQVNNFLRIIEVLNLSLEDFGVKLTKRTDNEAKSELISKILATPTGKIKLYNKAFNLIDEAALNN